MAGEDRPVVLVVEDEPDVAETYELWLERDYEVRLAGDGETGLEAVDETVDVVLLDRMLPGMSGAEVLAEIRERDVGVRVAMVTAVDPDFDIIEMGFDDYVQKPPTRTELRETVEELLERGTFTEDLREFRSLVDTRAALETEKSEADLAESEEVADLDERIEALDDRLAEDDERLLDDAEFVATLREVAGEEGADE